MMKINYRLILVLAAIVASFVVGNAAAHIKNEASQFPDIEFSDERFDIVLLVGAGIIPETPVFEPDAPFSRAALASWAALAENLGVGGETPDTETLAAAALERGLIESIDGQATYEDVNKAFFRRQLTLDRPAAIPTKGEAAGTIGDMSLPMYAHGRVANGPTDLVQWDGRTMRRSFIREQGDLAFWTYLEAEPIATPEDDGASAAIDEQSMPEASTNRRLLYGLVAAASGLGLILFFQGRRSS
jgi:hypothetical protein